MGNLKGGISHLSCLFAEDGAKKPLLRGQLRLSLGGNLTHQDISGTHLCADTDNSSLVQIL